MIVTRVMEVQFTMDDLRGALLAQGIQIPACATAVLVHAKSPRDGVAGAVVGIRFSWEVPEPPKPTVEPAP